MTYFALTIIGRAIMGVGKTPAEAIKDAKYYNERECGELPDDPTDNIYRGDDDGEWHSYAIPEAD